MKVMARPHGVKRNKVRLSKASEHRSICSSCVNLALCAFVNGSAQQQPVLYCEEFYSGNGGSAPIACKMEITISDERGGIENRKGLCVNCDNCVSCGFPEYEGGIWHCEEYQ